MDKKRIALVVPSFGEGGGVPVTAQAIYRGLIASGRYDASVISLATSRHDPDSVRLAAPDTWLRGITTSQGIHGEVPFTQVGASAVELEFRRYASRPVLTGLLQKYDLIQVVCGTPVWALPARVPGIPLFVSMATLTAIERKSRQADYHGIGGAWFSLMTRLTHHLDHTGARSADRIFVINHWTEEYLKRFIDPDKIVFAPHGVDTQRFCPDAQRGYNGNGYILSVGRFSDPRKNVRLLFEAYALLIKARPGAPDLLLAGNTLPGKREMEHAKNLGIVERIRLRENPSVAELQEIYRGASLYVLSSDEEGLGIVILEAMASGLPVIATRCGGPETVVRVEETGLLTPVGDASALSESMGLLIANAERRERMGKRGREVAETSYSLSAFFRPYLEQYDRVLYP